MTDDVLHLEVWKGNWDLPSADHECLAVWAYCKFSGLPTKVIKSHELNAFKSSLGSYDLPVLLHGTNVESQLGNIFTYLKNQGLGIDQNLTSTQLADISAFSAMIEEKLLPSILHQWWVDTDIYTEVTRPFFASASPFPLNYTVPGRLQRSAIQKVFVPRLEDGVITKEEVVNNIYKEARECLNHLSHRLGEEDYFFGSQPSSLDALVFGFIAPLLNGPLSSSTLANHVKGCQNLSALCNRVLSKYIPMSPEDLERKRQQEAERKEELQMDAIAFPNKKRNMVLAALFALTINLSFALFRGIIKNIVINHSHDEEFYSEEGDEDYDEGGYDEER